LNNDKPNPNNGRILNNDRPTNGRPSNIDRPTNGRPNPTNGRPSNNDRPNPTNGRPSNNDRPNPNNGRLLNNVPNNVRLLNNDKNVGRTPNKNYRHKNNENHQRPIKSDNFSIEKITKIDDVENFYELYFKDQERIRLKEIETEKLYKPPEDWVKKLIPVVFKKN
jgi:hypothetical protein